MTKTLFLFALLLIGLVSCGPSEQADDGTLQVVATTSMIADLVRQIGGDAVSVTGLMGPGIDPHLYRASEGDVRAMSGADVIFYNGLDLEGKLSDVLARLERGNTITYAVASVLPEDELLRPEEFQGNFDPHVWMDVERWSEVVDGVTQTLAEAEPAQADGFRERAAAYTQTLDSLDAYVQSRVAEVPETRRVLVTAHDAFNYFGDAYGFDVRGLQGISTASEAGTADVRNLAEFVAEREIPALFVETSISPKAIEAVREAVRSRGHEVEIGGNLYSDALGPSGSGADTYEGMIRHNVDTIVDALR